jgi:hypothetical protein
MIPMRPNRIGEDVDSIHLHEKRCMAEPISASKPEDKPRRLYSILWRIPNPVPGHLLLLQYLDEQFTLRRDFGLLSVPVSENIVYRFEKANIAK